MSRDMRATQYQGVDFRGSCTISGFGFTAMAYDERSDSMLFVGQQWDGQVKARTIPAWDRAILQPSPPAPRRPTWNLIG